MTDARKAMYERILGRPISDHEADGIQRERDIWTKYERGKRKLENCPAIGNGHERRFDTSYGGRVHVLLYRDLQAAKLRQERKLIAVS